MVAATITPRRRGRAGALPIAVSIAILSLPVFYLVYGASLCVTLPACRKRDDFARIHAAAGASGGAQPGRSIFKTASLPTALTLPLRTGTSACPARQLSS